MKKALLSSFITGLLSISQFTYAVVIDQRDPRFQLAMEHLAAAERALEVYQEELQKAEAAYPMPGLNLIKLLAPSQEIRESLNLLLKPEVVRRETLTIKPDSLFFRDLEKTSLQQ